MLCSEMEYTLLFALATVAGIQAGPIQEINVVEQCAKQCTVSNQFNYEPGMSYEFQYNNEIRTALQGASEEHAGLDLYATVHIDVISKCEIVMRLSGVTLKEHDPETSTMKTLTSDLKDSLEKNPLRVSFQDGSIEEVCLTAPESIKVLNIKRGILSVFQNKMDDITKDETVSESDVAGNCEAEYTSAEKGWYNLLIKKSKNLLGCTGRHSSTSAVQGIPYDSKSNIQSVPLIKSTHNCEQDVVKATGRLNSAMCQETHVFAPFSRQNSGAITHNTQTLTFVKETKSRSKPAPVTTRASLQFDHAYDADKQAGNRKEVERKLMEICSTTNNGVLPETPRLFTALVQSMKTMEASDMSMVYEKIKSQTICSENNQRVSKFFLDAIPMVGSAASLKMMTQLITSLEVTGIEADMWLTTLAFIQNPTVDMLTEVKPLLSMNTQEEKAMLSVSSLVHIFCRNSDCDNIREVAKIISLLEGKIGSCQVTDSNMKTTLFALRAIGNAGFGAQAIPSLTKCIQLSGNPIEIRLSAIEAFRRISCKADKSRIMQIFTDLAEDSEIRIAAYKSLMECPSEDILGKVKVTLAKEEVNQVGSYVWSHLTNLMETADPHKQTIRGILEDATLQKEFDMDKRKFSRNYEGSLFIEKLNSGAAVEGDMIWSSKSFIPRSAMLNLTVDLFGSAINLLEIGGRAEGLEYFLESYFGPNGYFSENDVQTGADETAVQAIKADKAARINKRMGSVMDELRGSLYMRVFGNELRYMNFQGLDSLLSQDSFNFLDVLMKLTKENDFQFTQSIMFLDSNIIIPTSSGFPLNLKVNGTSTVDLKASGKMDVMKLSSSPPTIDIHGTIRPSAAVEITSTMTVDALVTKVGLKMISSLHSNTAVQGKISLSQGTILNVQFDLPEDKMEVISVKSSFFTVHRDLEREQTMITENKQEKSVCSGTTLAEITGLELCGELQYPNASLVENAPYFPLTGPVKAGVTLYKRDSLTGYKLEARSTHTQDSNIIRLAFSTPNSKIDRSFGIDFNLNKVDKTFDTSFTSPWTKADFKGAVSNDRNLKGISGKLNFDGTDRYEVKASVQSQRTAIGMEYMPSLMIRATGKEQMDLSGTVKYAPWKLVDVDMTLNGITKSPIIFKSSMINKQKLIRASASIKGGAKGEYSVDSSVQIDENKKTIMYKPQISVRTPTAEVFAFGGSLTNIIGKGIRLDATLDKVVESPIKIKASVMKKAYRRGRELYNVNLHMKSPVAEIKTKAKLDNRNMKTLTTDIDLTYVIKRYARDSIKFVSKVINLSSNSLTKAKATMSLASKKSPQLNFKLLGNINHNKKHSEMDIDLKYGANPKDVDKQISMATSLDRAIKSWSVAKIAFDGQFQMGKDLRIVTKLGHSHDKMSLDSNVLLRVNKDAVTSKLNLEKKSAKLANIVGQFELSYPGKTVVLSQIINETTQGEFTSTMSARIGKSINIVMTSWKITSPTSMTITSDINLNDMEPLRVEVEYNLGPQTYKVGGSFLKGSSKYRASASSQVDIGRSVQVFTDIIYPSRHIVANLEGTKDGIKYTSRADVRWNADKDDTQRFTVNGNGLVSGMDNIEGSLTVQYPSRTFAVNVKHSAGRKYSSHIDFQWKRNQGISIDTIFGNFQKPNSREIVSTLKLKTPFQPLKSLDLTMSHEIEDSKYKSKLDIKWNPKNIISTTFTLKRPFSIQNIDAEFVGKTPFAHFKTVDASMTHTLRNGLSSLGKLNWNKKSVTMNLSFGNKNTETVTDLKGQVDIKTSFNALKTATITFSHNSNGKVFDTSAMLGYNKMQYGVQSIIKHKLSGWNINNNGEVKLISPSDTATIKWDHSNTLKDVTTSTEITWGNNRRVFVKYSGMQDMTFAVGSVSSALEIQTPWNKLRDIVIQINHEHRQGQIDSNMKITNEGTTLAFAEGKYLRENGHITSSIVMSNPIYDGDVVVKLNMAYTNYPKTGYLEVSLTPLQTITVDASYNKALNGDIETSVKISPATMTPVSIHGSRHVTQSGIQSVVSVVRGSEIFMRIESLHRLDAEKMIKITFTSDLTKEYTAEAALKMDANSLQARANIEAQPHIGKWSAVASVDATNGFTGNVKVNTPYTTARYSQITLTSIMTDGARQSSLIIEYLPKKTIVLNSQYSLQDIRNIRMSVDLTTTFEQLPYSAIAFTHRGDLREFSNHGEMEYKRGSKLMVDSTFLTRDGYQGSLSIKTPFTEEMKGFFSHFGSNDAIQSHGEVTWGKTVTADLKHTGNTHKFTTGIAFSNGDDEVTGNVDFNLGPKMTTTISFKTPLKQLRDVSMSHSLEGTLTKFSHHAEISYSKDKQYVADISFDMETRISGDLSIRTPIKGYNNMKASISHEGTWARFQTHAEAQNGESKLSGDVKLNSEPAFNFEASVQTPLKTFELTRLSLTHDGELDYFKTHIEAQQNKDTTEMDLVFNNKKKLDIDLTIRSPYTDTIKASLDHWGSMQRFTSKFQAKVGSKKVVSAVRFQIRPDFNTEISIKTPFSYLKNQQLSIKHVGTFNSFECNMEYKCNGDKYVGDVSYQHLDNLKGELNFNGPSFNPVSVKVAHEGPLDNFKSSGELSMGKKSIRVDANLNTVNGVKGNVVVSTPFAGIKSITAGVSHTGSVNNFVSHGEFVFNKKQGQIDITVDATRDLLATITIATPFEGYEDITSSVKHFGNMQQFNTVAAYGMNGKTLEGTINFNNEVSLRASTSLKSSFPEIDEFSALFTLQGNFNKFNTHGEVKLAKERSDIDIAFDSTRDYEGSASINTPTLKNTEVGFKHTSTDSSLNSIAHITYNGVKQYNMRSDMSFKPSISVKLTVNTPINGLEATEISVDHVWESDNFRSNAVLLLKGERSEVELTFVTLPDLQGKLTIKSPITKNVETTVIYSGKPSNFRSAFEYAYGGQIQLRTEAALNTEGPLSGEFRLVSPLVKPLKGSYNINGNFIKSQSDAQLSYGSKQIHATANVNYPSDGEFIIISPITGYENTRVSLRHSSIQNGIDSHAEIEINGVRHEGDIVFNSGNALSGTIALNSPMILPISTRVDYLGKPTNFQSHAEFVYGNNKHQVDATFNMEKNVQGSLAIKSPLMSDLSMSFDTNNDLSNLDSRGELNYGNNKLLDIELSLQTEARKSGSVVMRIPQNIAKAGFTLDGDLNSFTGHAEATLNDKTNEGDITFSKLNNVEGSLRIQSPFTVPISGSFNYNGKPRNFISQAEVTIDSERNAVDVTFNTINRLETSITLTSPMIVPISAKLAIDGESSRFSSNAEITVDSETSEADITLNLIGQIDGSISLKSPIITPFAAKVSLNTQRDNMNFKGHAEASLNDQTVQADASFIVADDIRGNMKLTSPFSDLELSFTHAGKINNFRSNVEFISDDKKTEANVVFNAETALEGSFSLSTPMTDTMRASFEHTGPLTKFRSLASAEYGKKYVLNAEASFNSLPLKGSITVSTPIKGFETIAASFSHDGKILDFSNHAELTIAGEKTEADMSLNIGSKLEGRISASSPYFPSTKSGFDFSGNVGNFVSHVDFSYNSKVYAVDATLDTKSRVDSTMTITTPVEGYKSIVASLSHSGRFPNINTVIQAKIGRRSLALVRAQISNTNGMVAQASVQSVITPTIQMNLGYKGPMSAFTSNGDIRYNGQSSSINVAFKSAPAVEVSLTVSTPFTDSFSGNFKFQTQFDDVSAHAEGSLGSKTISGDVTFVNGNEIGSTIDIKTPFQGFENMQGAAKYSKTDKGFRGQVTLEIKPTQKIQVEAESNWRNGLTGSVSLQSPFESIRHSSANFNLEGAFPNVKYGLHALHSNKQYSIEGEIAHQDSTIGKLSVSTPFEGYENIGLNFNRKGQITDMQADLKLVYTAGKEIVASIQNTQTEGRLETKAQFESPYTEDISFELSYNGNPSDFSNTIVLSMGKENTFTSETTFKLEKSSVILDTSLSTVFSGYFDKQTVRLNYGSLPTFKVLTYAKLFGSVYSLDSSLQTESNINGKLVLRTPFKNFRDVALSVEHSGNSRSFSTKTELQFDTAKKIEANIQYYKHGWRRLQTSLEVLTPFAGAERSRMSYKHSASVDSFESTAEASVFNKDVSGSLRASNAPISVTLAITTPFETYEQLGADMKLDYGTNFYNAEANVMLMQGKSISLSSEINLNPSTKLAHVKVSTPFAGYETSEIRMTHTGDLKNFQSVTSLSTPMVPAMRVQANLRSSTWSNVDGTLTFTSQIKNLENLRFILKNGAISGKYTSRVEASWAPSHSIILDGTVTDNKDSMNGEVSLKTPFTTLRQFNLKSESQVRSTQYTQTFSTQYNGETYADLDMEVDFAPKKSASLLMRSPKQMSIEVGSSTSNGKYEGKASINTDTKNTNNAFNMDAMLDTNTNEMSFKHSCPDMTLSFDGTFQKTNSKADLYIDNVRYGYDMSLTNNDGRIKVILPTRSLQVFASQRYRSNEGSFMWDADKDESKKIGFRSYVTPSADSVKADVTFMMPSIGKDVQVDSEMLLNRGSVIFDGKTEFTYSKDSRKKFTITSRLEDISSGWSSKNYSFILGVSHPYTNVGVQMSSHLGKSDSKLTAALDVKYLTVRSDTKTFSVNGEINKLRNSVKFDMNTPVKKISIVGNAQLASPFSLSVTNQYDDNRPLNTIVSFDPKKRSMDFQINYDLDNPTSEFHINAKYVNSSAVSAEVFHVINRQRITDALVALRLNNSHLLHSRIHWRPTMINDLKEFVNKKENSYRRRLANLNEIVYNSVESELTQKASLLGDSVMEEIAPLTTDLSEMYDVNMYHIKDVTDAVFASAKDAKVVFEDISIVTKEYINMIANRLESTLNISVDLSCLRGALGYISTQNSRLSGNLYNMTQHESVLTLKEKYNDYIQYMYQINSIPSHVSNMADQYTSAIYDARDLINGRVMQQGLNAYKYWEIRENAENVAKAIIDWIRDEIEKELSDIQATILNFEKTSVTVYDPKNGEIQMDIHMPLPLQSLDVIPTFDVTPYITKAKTYMPKVHSVTLPSSDVSTWLPPYDAIASIEGNKVTTFDGLTYDLGGSCTFLLARDFVDGNFSIALNRNDNQKSLHIMDDGKDIEIQSNGQVLMNRQPIELPSVRKNIIITSVDGHVKVEGAGNFEVDYYKDLDTYTIKINGWYYGKTSGLLGTYDNEPSNDMMTSYGRTVDTAERFTKTWDIGNARCR